ncbi:MAG: hypothetical protein HRU19_30425 [Pseudobacteriovorax sp.]|nr:hypothetical protein [Pseudobacteriovorax sp.]
MLTVVIANPNSKRNLRHLEKKLIKDFPQLSPLQIIATRNYDEVEGKTRSALQDGVKNIIVCGGDGTVAKAASGFFFEGTNCFPHASLGIIPGGTGNDYFRGISRGRSWEEILEGGIVKSVDIGEIETESKRLYFFNSLSLGVSAIVVERRATLHRWVPRSLSYFVSTVSCLPWFNTQSLKVNIDGAESTQSFWAWFISKGSYSGGGMRLGLKDNLDSGFFFSLKIRPIPKRKLLVRLPLLYSEGIKNSAVVEAHRFRSVSFFSEKPALLEVDGESHIFESAIVTIKPKTIRIFT